MGNKVQKSIKILGLIFVLISLLHIFYASCSQRGLFFEGSYLFLQMLQNISNKSFAIIYNPDHPCSMVCWLQTIPTLLAGIILGIKSKITLATFYSFTLFLVPFLALWWNFELTKRTKEYGILAASIFTFCVILLPFDIAVQKTALIGVPLQFVLLNYLFGNINYSKRDKIGIGFILLMMFGVSEVTYFTGMLLFAGTFKAIFNEENSKNMLVKIFIGIGSLASSFYTFFFMTMVANKKMLLGRFFHESFCFWKNLLNFDILVSVITVLLVALLYLKKNTLNKKLKVLIGLLYVSLFAHMFLNLNVYINPNMEISVNSIVFWAVPLIFLVLILNKYNVIKNENKNFMNNMYIPVLLCGIVLTSWQIINTYYWNNNVAFFKNEIDNSQDILYNPSEHEEISSFKNKDLRRYIFHANYSALSVIFSKSYEVKTLVMNYDESTEEQDSYREKLWSNPEEQIINIPYNVNLSTKSKYWDLEEVSDALNSYNETYEIYTEKDDFNSEEE